MINFIVLADITFECDGFNVHTEETFIKSVMAMDKSEAIEIGQKYFNEASEMSCGVLYFNGERIAFDGGPCYQLKAIENVIVLS